MKKKSLINKVILFAIIVIPAIICIILEYSYKDLGYNIGEFTGYTLEIKRYTDTTSYVPGVEIYYTSSRVKQLYNVKENDYISESLGKNLEKKVDTSYNASAPTESTINSFNRIILTIEQLNKSDATISVLQSNGYEKISLKYGKSYKIKLGNSSYTIKFKKVKT